MLEHFAWVCTASAVASINGLVAHTILSRFRSTSSSPNAVPSQLPISGTRSTLPHTRPFDKYIPKYIHFSRLPIAPLSSLYSLKEIRRSAQWAFELNDEFLGPGILSEIRSLFISVSRNFPKRHFLSYVYWTVHHLDSWIKRDQLDVTCFIISLFNHLALEMNI